MPTAAASNPDLMFPIFPASLTARDWRRSIRRVPEIAGFTRSIEHCLGVSSKPLLLRKRSTVDHGGGQPHVAVSYPTEPSEAR